MNSEQQKPTASLIHADARSLPLADESVGLILADPPFNVNLKRARWKDDLLPKDYRQFIRAFMAEGFRVARPGCLFYCFSCDTPIKMGMFQTAGQCVGWSYVQLCFWYTRNLVGYQPRFPWIPQQEPVLLFRKGTRIPMLHGPQGLGTGNVWDFLRPQTNFNHNKRFHPCQKPVDLWSTIIARSPGSPVLDLFCGAGNSAIAALKNGRSWIGVDLDYFEVSREKVRDAEQAIPFPASPPAQAEIFAESWRSDG